MVISVLRVKHGIAHPFIYISKHFTIFLYIYVSNYAGSRLMLTYMTSETTPDHKGFIAQYEAICGGKYLVLAARKFYS